jgi:membrane protein implicated in regulation of membrane protease activity
MTAPRAPQWQLTIPIRFAALALLCAGVGFLVESWWLAVVLWLGAVVFLVLAAVRLAKVWRSRPKNTPT